MNLFEKEHNIDTSLFLLRLGTGGLMLFHGIHKLIHGHDFIKTVLTGKGLPEFLWLGVPIAEVIAPILLILGILNRLSALLITIVMLFSIYLAFGFEAFNLTQHGGLKAEFNIYFIFVGIALFLSGGGKYSLLKPDNKWLQ